MRNQARVLRRRHDAILAYIDEHSSESIKLQSMGKCLGMSSSTITRTLRSFGAVSFWKLLAESRINRALSLLRSGQCEKIEALAASVGWRSRASFYRSLRKVTGRSLDEIRRELDCQ